MPLLAPVFAPLLLAAAAAPITLDVDAASFPRHIVHAREVMPVSAGPLTLQYPKYIPGEHGPTGPVDGVVNLVIRAGGKPLPWRRDLRDAWSLHVDVPPGVATLELQFDFVTEKGGTFSGSLASTENLGVLSFNHVLFLPGGTKSDEVQVHARVTVPRGWSHGSALLTMKRAGDVVDFETTSATTVVDSPLLMGRYFKRIELAPRHAISIAADSMAALEIPADTVTAWKQLVAEENAAFGASHYRHYEFLLVLSDEVEIFGLEHHESSDNRIFERNLVDDDKRVVLATLLPHEYAHSWNGKFRRPAGLATGDYTAHMSTDLIWVYEGLTEYLAWVFAARSGLEIEEEWKASRALFSADVLERGGRKWRPLQDTADDAHQLYMTGGKWRDVRRFVDFYDESALLWLGVDVKIRELSGGKKSLDDFLAAFHGGTSGAAEVKTYTFDDVIAALNAVAAYDWRAYWRAALDGTSTTAPADALRAAGWRLAFVEEAPAVFKAYEGASKARDLRFSIGLALDGESGEVTDVMDGSAAWKAGVTPGMKLIAVNGRKDSAEVLADAIVAAKKSKAPIELLVENSGFYRTFKVDYHGGPRFPLLMRDDKAPDVLRQILAPRTPHAARTKKPD